ncbi:MAG: hypothetical protein GY804_01220 [Alphaproteobacteria bacterium]|nr:hypothetical protein [Alphaproteobacteria bacterium]
MPKGIPAKSIDECSQIINDWKSSGLLIPEYCRKNNIPLISFRKYQQKVIKEADQLDLQTKFEEIEFSAESSPQNLKTALCSEMTVSFGGNVNVTLKPGFNQDEFSKVVQVLSGVLC